MTMKGGILLILIISTTITIINKVEAGGRAKRDSDEDLDSEKEEKEEQSTCANAAPSSSASLSHTFRDMPTLFEHVMGLLQRDSSVLEQNKQMDKREANTVNTQRLRDPVSQANQNGRITQNTRTTRSGRSAPTRENLERLLNQLERKLTEDNISRHAKREIKKITTARGRKSGSVIRKSRVKRDENGIINENLSKSNETENWRHNKNEYKRNEISEMEYNDQDNIIEKRSVDDDDVGDSDRDLVKEEAGGGGTQAPPNTDDNSDQARAESGSGGGGQQMVMGTFQAMMMPMQGANQAISGLMSSG